MQVTSSLRRKAMIAALTLITTIGTLGPLASESNAHHFGFRGGFRGGFGRSVRHSSGFRGIKKFGLSRARSFRRSGFRGLGGFGRSKFNSLAFRGRRFGSSGFNRFHGSNRFNQFAFKGTRNRFSSFRPRQNSFALSHFPTTRFHSSFGSFHQPVRVVAKPVYRSNFVSGNGWNHLAQGHPVQAGSVFANQLNKNGASGITRVGFALASADAGNLEQGVWAMRRAFEMDSENVYKMMLDDAVRPTAERVTRAYEKNLESNMGSEDDSFMLAALYQMQGDPEMAMMAMDYAEKAGNIDKATTKLKSLINDQMAIVPMTTSVGWKLLADGNAKAAVDSFVTEIGSDASAGVPKLGFALAAAACGDLKTGKWAMQRAFSVDPDGVSDVMLSGKMRPMIQDIIEKYEADAISGEMKGDNALILATLYQLQGDVEAANFMVKEGPMNADQYVAKMITEEMELQEEMMGKAMVQMDFVAKPKPSANASGMIDLPMPEMDSRVINLPAPDELAVMRKAS